MADGISEASDGTFPACDANGELNPGDNKEFKVDSSACEIAISREMKERIEAQQKKEKLKTAILISAAAVAVAGAAVAITKKLREK